MKRRKREKRLARQCLQCFFFSCRRKAAKGAANERAGDSRVIGRNRLATSNLPTPLPLLLVVSLSCANPAFSPSTCRPEIRVGNNGCEFDTLLLRSCKSMANVSAFRGSFRKFSTGKSSTRHEQTERSARLNSIADMSCDNLAPSSRGTRSSSPPSSPVPSLLRCTSQHGGSFRILAIANLGIHNQCIRLHFQQDLGQHQPGRTYFSTSFRRRRLPY